VLRLVFFSTTQVEPASTFLPAALETTAVVSAVAQDIINISIIKATIEAKVLNFFFLLIIFLLLPKKVAGFL
jgi:hypothetical protein